LANVAEAVYRSVHVAFWRKNDGGMFVIKSAAGIPVVKVTSGAAVPDVTLIATTFNVKS
jgi:hypothetical protein